MRTVAGAPRNGLRAVLADRLRRRGGIRLSRAGRAAQRRRDMTNLIDSSRECAQRHDVHSHIPGGTAMRTTWRSWSPAPFVAASLAALLLLAPGLGGTASAQFPPCNGSLPPMCDGACPPGDACVDMGGICNCVPVAGEPCGLVAGPPMCWGDCPPDKPVCVENGGICECAVPTLSEWGIIAMTLVMFAGVLHLRRRRVSA